MRTDLTAVFVLPSDVLLIPVEELAPATRARLEAGTGHVAVTRRRSRRRSSVLDADAARLVALFREPTTLVDAILRFSRATGADPRVVLESAFPLLEGLVTGGVLVPSGDERARPIHGTVRPGDTFGDFTVLRRVHLLEDVEIHCARSSAGAFAALKVARPGHVEPLRAALAREAAILARLDGRGAPSLLAVALDAPLPYIAVRWCAGVSPTRAAAEHRAGCASTRRALLDLCVRIAEAYADLHDRGVLHGDVHDRNVLVGPDGGITLLDFGIAAVPADPSVGWAQRGGVPDYHDPQLAQAMRLDARPPALDASAEQFSVAALLYLVVTGETHLDLSLRRQEALRQIVEDPSSSFEARGAPPWPELEAVLGRSLSKEPADRYPSVRDLAHALRGVSAPVSAAAVSTRGTDRRRFITALVERLEPGGALYADGLPLGPLSSVNYGAAGIAYAFHRMAAAREDALLLAYADAWIARARAWGSAPGAWYADGAGIEKKNVGPVALYHTATGVHCVETLIALAAGDGARATRCAGEFVAASGTRSANIDLTLGKAGLVLGATLMLEASPTAWPELRRRAGLMAGSIEKRVSGFGTLTHERRLTSVGMAHGWSGVLWTLLRWHRSSGTAMPEWVEDRLRELADLATPRGRGLAWTWSTDGFEAKGAPPAVPSWCNGSAGHVHTWLEAHAAFGEERYLDLATAAAWDVWDESRDALPDACCGLVGRAYALLALHRRTGDTAWRRRAEGLADRALSAVTPHAPDAHRLYKGALGVALLLEELESAPEDARMPLFESEGWTWARW